MDKKKYVYNDNPIRIKAKTKERLIEFWSYIVEMGTHSIDINIHLEKHSYDALINYLLDLVIKKLV